MKIYSRYLFVFLLLIPVFLFGETVTVYEETFDFPWNTGDWDQYTPEGGAWATQLAPYICQGDQSVSHWDNAEPVNGWIISDLISLQAGITYTCSFQQRVGNSSFRENMGTYIYQGNGADFTPGTATAEIWQADDLSNETCASRAGTFTVPSDGNYNIVFHCTSAADEFIAIWDYVIITRPTPVLPPQIATNALIFPSENSIIFVSMFTNIIWHVDKITDNIDGTNLTITSITLHYADTTNYILEVTNNIDNVLGEIEMNIPDGNWDGETNYVLKFEVVDSSSLTNSRIFWDNKFIIVPEGGILWIIGLLVPLIIRGCPQGRGILIMDYWKKEKI